MSKFKVGDVLIGNRNANIYGYTKEGVKVRVMRVLDDITIYVQVINKDINPNPYYNVNSKCFDLLERTEIQPMLPGLDR